MSRLVALSGALCFLCALAILGGSVMVAAQAGDGILLAGTLCAVSGVLLLSSWRPRFQAASGYRRGRVRVRKAFVLETIAGESDRTRASTRGRVHPAA